MSGPLIMKWHFWPKADRDAWVALFQRGEDHFDEDGAGCDWADGTRSKFEQAYGHWLSHLARNDLLDERAPADRISIETVRLFKQETEARISGRSTAGLVKDLYIIATALDPDRDWTWLKNASNRLLQLHPHELNRRRSVTAAEIASWADAEMTAALSMPDTGSWERPIRFRDGLMVGLLIARPLRLRTFIAIEIGRHLVTDESGTRLVFEPGDIKDRKRHEWSFPDHLLDPLERYLTEFRPALLRGNETKALWASRTGGPLSYAGLQENLANITARAFGETLRPHAFRDIAATSIAEEDPLHVAITPGVLGHSTLQMAQKHYNRASSVKASAAWQDLIHERRRAGRTKCRKKRDSHFREKVE
ncbi:tyrosine-type recombinase/integrase [Georhizobium sp. MAB10]|uniref:tyrosine-type recombinase/integrase n=1 Tax=Georhizobium sp. MAB10 TaxID=3028319 RepID=UPI0038559690